MAALRPLASSLPWILAALVGGRALPAQQEPAQQEPRIASGPARGSALGPLRVAALAGPEAGSEYDLAARCARGPAAILFVHELTRNVAPLLRAFDEQCADLAVIGLRSATVLLAADRTAAEQRVPVVSRALQMLAPMVLSVDGAEGPGGYALHRKAELTLVLAHDGVVTDAFALVDTGRQDLDLLAASLAALVGPVPTDEELPAALAAALPQDRDALVELVVRLERQRRRLCEQREEALRQRGTDRARREPGMRGQGPGDTTGGGMRADAPARPAPLQLVEDAELGAILRRIVRRDADAAALDEAFAALDRRLAAAAGLREPARRAVARVLDETDYGNEAARARLRAWLGREDRPR